SDETMDKAISLEVIEHMCDIPSFLAELARVLKPGGRLVISTPLKRPDGALQDRYHVQEFDHESLRAALRPAFSNIQVFSCWPGKLQQSYESNRPFLLAAKIRRAFTRISAYRGCNPFVGPVQPNSHCPLIVAVAFKDQRSHCSA